MRVRALRAGASSCPRSVPAIAPVFAPVAPIFVAIAHVLAAIAAILDPVAHAAMMSGVTAIFAPIADVLAPVAPILAPIASVLDTVANAVAPGVSRCRRRQDGQRREESGGDEQSGGAVRSNHGDVLLMMRGSFCRHRHPLDRPGGLGVESTQFRRSRPVGSSAMSPQRIGAIVAVVVVTPWAVVVIALYVFRLLVCADTDLQRKTSPDGRTVAIERGEACLTKHATALYLERAGLPRMTLVWARVTRVQGAEPEWHGDRELRVTLVASGAEAAAAAEDAPRRFDDVTIRYFDRKGEELADGPPETP